MIAIIPCAGFGTRLNSLGKNTPKALINIGNITILDHIIKKIKEIPIKKIYIITNNKFHNQFLEWNKNNNIIILNDGVNTNEERLGMLNDMLLAIKTYRINDDLLVMGGDNLFEFSLRDMYSYFKKMNNSIIAVYRLATIKEASRFGCVTLNKTNKVINFIEKPEKPKSNLVSPSIYMFKKSIIPLIEEYLSKNLNPDATGFFLEWLYKQIELYAFEIKGKWFDVGTVETYEKAKKFNWINL